MSGWAGRQPSVRCRGPGAIRRLIRTDARRAAEAKTGSFMERPARPRRRPMSPDSHLVVGELPLTAAGQAGIRVACAQSLPDARQPETWLAQARGPHPLRLAQLQRPAGHHGQLERTMKSVQANSSSLACGPCQCRSGRLQRARPTGCSPSQTFRIRRWQSGDVLGGYGLPPIRLMRASRVRPYVCRSAPDSSRSTGSETLVAISAIVCSGIPRR